ncbi:MAG: LysR family transcriptional regulator, partial [Comamonas sp.]
MSEPDHFEQEQFDAFDDESAPSRSLSSDSVSQALGYDMADRRIAILRGIAQSGSISQAARDVGVSYKAAWQAIDTLTNLAGAPLVERSVGGAGGGGAQITAAGESLLATAETMERMRAEVLQRVQSGQSPGDAPAVVNLGLMTSMRNQWPCTVLKVESMGGQIRVWLRAAMEAGSDWTIAARITPESYELLGLAPGVKVL